MACGNVREAFTAGGEATLLSLEVCNVDAFVVLNATSSSPALKDNATPCGRPYVGQ